MEKLLLHLLSIICSTWQEAGELAHLWQEAAEWMEQRQSVISMKFSEGMP